MAGQAEGGFGELPGEADGGEEGEHEDRGEEQAFQDDEDEDERPVLEPGRGQEGWRHSHQNQQRAEAVTVTHGCFLVSSRSCVNPQKTDCRANPMPNATKIAQSHFRQSLKIFVPMY